MVLVVSHDPEVDRVPAFTPHQGHKRVAVGVTNLARGERAGTRDELVTRGQDADAWSGMDVDPLESLVGQDSEVTGCEDGTHLDHDVPHADVLSGMPDRLPDDQPLADHDHRAAFFERAVLEHAHGVGPRWEWGPGHDADGLPRTDRPVEGGAGHDRSHDVQAHRSVRIGRGGVIGPEGVPVPRGVREGRDRLGGRHPRRGHAAQGLVDGGEPRRSRRAGSEHECLGSPRGITSRRPGLRGSRRSSLFRPARFALPDGDGVLEGVDAVPGGIEGLGAVGVEAATTTETSPTSRRPIRWSSASRPIIGHCTRAEIATCSMRTTACSG